MVREDTNHCDYDSLEQRRNLHPAGMDYTEITGLPSIINDIHLQSVNKFLLPV